MGEFEFLVVFGIAIILSIIAMRVTWEISDYFIAPKEYFFKSSYKILLTKLGMCAGVGLITIIVTFKLNDIISPDKINTINSTKHKENIELIKTENKNQNTKNDKIDKNFEEPLETDKVIKDTKPLIDIKQKGDMEIAIEMLKENKSIQEISESTLLSKKEIRILRRKLRKED